MRLAIVIVVASSGCTPRATSTAKTTRSPQSPEERRSSPAPRGAYASPEADVCAQEVSAASFAEKGWAFCLSRVSANSGWGQIVGFVRDDANGSPLAGVKVSASSASLPRIVETATDDSGCYAITRLPPGSYEVTLRFADLLLRRGGVRVDAAASAPVHARFNTGVAPGSSCTETITIGVGSTKGDHPDVQPRGMDPERNPWRGQP